MALKSGVFKDMKLLKKYIIIYENGKHPRASYKGKAFSTQTNLTTRLHKKYVYLHGRQYQQTIKILENINL